MVRRLFAFAVAFVVTGAPMVANVCEARCARHVGHPVDAKQPLAAHHHHHTAAAEADKSHRHDSSSEIARSKGAAATAVPPACGDLDVVVTGLGPRGRAPVWNVVLTKDFISPMPVRVTGYSASDYRQSPPGPVRPATPLRL